MAARPPRKCTQVGDGIGGGAAVHALSATGFRLVKSSTDRPRLRFSFSWTSNRGGENWMSPCSLWNLAGSPPCTSTPSIFSRKSRNQWRRWNSPSVHTLSPAAFFIPPACSTSLASMSRSSAAEISPFSRRARASWIVCGRNRLPTTPALNGGFDAGTGLLLLTQRLVGLDAGFPDGPGPLLLIGAQQLGGGPRAADRRSDG